MIWMDGHVLGGEILEEWGKVSQESLDIVFAK